MDALQQVMRGLAGVLVLLGIAFASSGDRRNIRWRIVATGILLQVLVVLALKVQWIENAFAFVGRVFVVQLRHVRLDRHARPLRRILDQ